MIGSLINHVHRFAPGIVLDAIYYLARFTPAFCLRLGSLLPSSRPPDKSFTAAVTNICNAKCVFCAYTKSEMPRGVMTEGIFKLGLEAWSAEGGKHIDLTPTVGDPLIDKSIESKIGLARKHGLTASFTTNAILLKGRSQSLLDAGLNELYVSLPSLDNDNYQRLYGVDKCENVLAGLSEFLVENKKRGEPCAVRLRFRNSQKPSRIVNSAPFRQHVAPHLSGRVAFNFTHGFDNWGGAIRESDMTGWMKLKPAIKSSKPCRSLYGMSMLHDGALRACACRFKTTERDDLVVGHISEGLAAARIRAGQIANDFTRGKRPDACLECSFYNPI